MKASKLKEKLEQAISENGDFNVYLPLYMPETLEIDAASLIEVVNLGMKHAGLHVHFYETSSGKKFYLIMPHEENIFDDYVSIGIGEKND